MRSLSIQFLAASGLVIGVVSAGCAPPENSSVLTPSIPEGAGSRNGLFRCPRASTEISVWERAHPGDTLKLWLERNAVLEPVPGIDKKYLVQLAFELDKLPERTREEMVDGGAKIHALQGRGVVEDPSWEGPVSTPDGRPWAEVPGAGGAPYLNTDQRYYPTRIVANRLYEGHGSANLVLHEHAHTLDSLKAPFEISQSAAWKELLARNPSFIRILDKACGKYCTEQFSEGFAEAVAIYHSCGKNRLRVETEAPEVAKYLEGLLD